MMETEWTYCVLYSMVQIHLVRVTQVEWRSNHTIEIEINKTLEISCIQNTSSEISYELTSAWLALFIQIHNDDPRFSRHITVGSDKTSNRSTTVKVFAKPESSMIAENNSMDVLGKNLRIRAIA
ncbi:hypothetical protein MC885_002475 [Smutsia gigantea]|nr:hypothetical protein MC885_002475 [Smutsia gigantea]